MLPLAPLNQRRGELFAALSGLRPVPHSPTGLDDTTLAAYEQARRQWRPGRLNLVLIATDGRNNDRDGIPADDLVARLAARQDPARPLPIIYLGIGPDVDADSLRAISAPTGGRAFLSADGSGIEELFFQALDFLTRSAAAGTRSAAAGTRSAAAGTRSAASTRAASTPATAARPAAGPPERRPPEHRRPSSAD